MSGFFIPEAPSNLSDDLGDWWREGYRAFLEGNTLETGELDWSMLRRQQIRAFKDGYAAAKRARGGDRGPAPEREGEPR